MHSEVLTEKGKTLFPLLKKFPGFYLAGGTALALQIGHRVSVDFDLFSDARIKKTLLAEVEGIFSGWPRNILVNNADELTVLIDGVKVTFLAYPFPVLLPKANADGLPLLSVKELGATKAYTLGRRGELKDYIDLYFILRENHATLPETIALAERKYCEAFDPRLFLEQLLYLDDVEDTSMLFLGKKADKAALKSFFKILIGKIEL